MNIVVAIAAAWSMATATTGSPPLVCGGTYVPPVDYDDARGGAAVTVEYAVAMADKATPRDRVMAMAQRNLVSRLCRLADPASCGLLEEKVRPWSSGEGAGQVCAMAIVRSSDLEAWRTMLAPDLGAELRRSFSVLLPEDDGGPGAGLIKIGKRKRRRSAVVVLDRIDDSGAPGGVRADWLLGRVRAALTELDVDMMEPPKDWTGRILPRGVEFKLQGSLVDRVDPKKQLPVIDLSFTVTNKQGLGRTSAPFSIPAALAPPAPSKVTSPPPIAGLSLHVVTRGSGSLCPGDYTQIHVTNETDEPLFVRVINLDSNGEALVLFPNEQIVDDQLAPGATVALSPDGFTVDGAANGRERYVAIGARSREALGRFRDARGTCRYAPRDAVVLKNGDKIEATFRGVGGFTLLDDVRCRKAIPLPDPQLLAGLLAELPICPALDR